MLGGAMIALLALAGIRAAAAQARDKPVPAEELSSAIEGDAANLTWSAPQQQGDVRYYVDVCRREPSGWVRIFGTYVRHPPFRLEHLKGNTLYAWRVLSVEANDPSNFAASSWVRLGPRQSEVGE
jgi:hypothetical protein